MPLSEQERAELDALERKFGGWKFIYMGRESLESKGAEDLVYGRSTELRDVEEDVANPAPIGIRLGTKSEYARYNELRIKAGLLKDGRNYGKHA